MHNLSILVFVIFLQFSDLDRHSSEEILQEVIESQMEPKTETESKNLTKFLVDEDSLMHLDDLVKATKFIDPELLLENNFPNKNSRKINKKTDEVDSGKSRKFARSVSMQNEPDLMAKSRTNTLEIPSVKTRSVRRRVSEWTNRNSDPVKGKKMHI